MIDLPVRNNTLPVERDKAIKSVFCLYRVSTMSQVEQDDIPMQRTACHEFVASKPGWYIKREFIEKGVSGFKVSAEDRDQLQELKACAERKEFDILLVFMFDRLGRRDDETPFIIRWFVRNGIEVWSVKEGQQEFNSIVDDLINYIRFWTAMSESVKTSARVSTKLRQMVEEGKFTGGTAPYGYHLVDSGEIRDGRLLKKLEIVPEEADVIRLIFHKTTVEGLGTHIVAESLNEMGVVTHNGCIFRSNGIIRMLRNPIYCGYYFRGGVVSPKLSELQIIEDDMYNEAQRLLNKRMLIQKHKEELVEVTKSQALLTGNLYCGSCGSRLIVTSHSSSYCNAKGEKCYYKRYRYMCVGRTLCRNKCHGQGTFSVKKADSLVVKHLRDSLKRINAISNESAFDRKYERMTANYNKRVNSLRRKEQTMNRQLKTLYSEIPDSINGKSTYTPELLSSAINELKEKLDAVTEKLNCVLSEHADNHQLRITIHRRLLEYRQLLSGFFEKDVTFDEQRTIILKLFDRITLARGNDKYDIRFKVRDDYKDFV